MRWVALALAVAFAAAMFPAAVGDHEQGEARRVTFDHKNGNEWWVEVVVGGPDGGSVSNVEARDEGGTWVPLEKRSWDAWAGSFHIEPGHDVRFRATFADDERVASCWFSHPEGVESCATAAPRFNHTGGNEWWVQVQVSDQPERVQAMDSDGAWQDLQLRDWGDWAGSFHIEPGHEVRFRALSGGERTTSCWFSHPDGSTRTGETTCRGATVDEGFDATFDPQPGNEWWVEVYVQADRPLATVAARDDGGPWIDLDKRSWGAWAGSFHVEDGSVVEFRATSTDGATDVSGGYRWPEAVPVAQAGTDAAFGPRAGNAWWVETYVVADGPVRSVDARADGGDWHPLTLRDWGTWAGSFHAPDGSVVEFRATTDEGRDISHGFVWPRAAPVGGDGSWPQEGSYAHYDTFASDPAPSSTEGTETLVYHDGSWWSWAESETQIHGGTRHNERSCMDARLPTGPTPVLVGQRVDVQVGTCHEQVYDVIVRHPDTEDTHREGRPVTVQTWYADRTDPCGCLRWEAEWDQETGIVLHSDRAGRGSVGMDLVDTDAPIG